MKSTALITPSWLPDISRCEELLSSAAQYTRGFSDHYVLIDAQDEKLFRRRLGMQCELVIKEDLLPGWLHQSRLDRQWWWSMQALPVRGWILQQITKLAVTQYLGEEAFCFVDSDIGFIRPFGAENLWSNGKLKYYRSTRKPYFYTSYRYRNWYQFAADQFDLGEEKNLNGAYIAQLSAMNKATVRQLLAHIEVKRGRSWLEVLLQSMDFSEFVLYGVYVDEVLNNEGHEPMAESFCHGSWFFDLENREDFNRLTEVAADQFAVPLQSKSGRSKLLETMLVTE